MNKTRFIHFPLLLAVLTLAIGLVWHTQPTKAGPGQAAETNLQSVNAVNNYLYLPIIAHITSFSPPGNATLPGGTYTFSSFHVPENVTVTVTGDVHITVTGDTHIAGTLAGDCVEIQLHGQQDVTVTGTVDNACSNNDTDGADLVIQAHQGHIKLGTFSKIAIIRTSGSVDVGNAPDLEQWEVDVLPGQESATPMDPVCSAQADIIGDSVTSDFPVEVVFWGEGIDPNRGPVSYVWDFGDGHTAAEQDTSHTYTSWGVYQATLTVTDGSGAICQASLQIVLEDADGNIPDAPGVQMAPLDMVMAVGETAVFSSEDFHFEEDELTYTWAYGDGATSDEPDGEHVYTSPGRYEVSLTVISSGGDTAVATASIYIHEANNSPAQSAQLAGGDCNNTDPDNVFNAALEHRETRRHGRPATLRGRGDFYIGGDATVFGQDGVDGRDEEGSGYIRGGNGGHGGTLQIRVRGRLTVCSGAQIAAGNGGQGGSALSETPAPNTSFARGGHGGKAGPRLLIRATQGMVFEATVTINPGNGGAGGEADAKGGSGDNECPVGKPGGRADARGGNGGLASKRVAVRGNIIGLNNILVDGGHGGVGGDALAQGGDGGFAFCQTVGEGGVGRSALSRGGRGGEAKLSGQWNLIPLAADAFTAGAGGLADALGGNGGSALVTPPGGTSATGGLAGNARSIGGRGGRGHNNGDAGDSFADGGVGGNGNAMGEAGGACEDGLDATAVGGKGGNATARKGRPGGSGAAEGVTEATGGDGGDGTATGGRGGDCDVCPAGQGGDGGAATATGGDGGNAFGNGILTGGDGGIGDALGGRGGDGADCCGPPDLAGGDGGAGGAATSTAGSPGSPAGNWGGNATSGGNGGDGGDGEGPGSGGPGGPGSGTPNGIPNGLPGADGEECPDPPPPIDPRQGTPNHGQIPDGPIPPGSQHDLDLIDPDDPDIIGIVPTRFMSEDELLPYDVPGALYEKMPDHIFVGVGGINYDLNLLPDDFLVLGVEFTVVADCAAGCVVILGYYQDELIAMAQNEGLPGPETLLLPNPADTGSTAPYYDRIVILAFGPMTFDLLAITFLNG